MKLLAILFLSLNINALYASGGGGGGAGGSSSEMDDFSEAIEQATDEATEDVKTDEEAVDKKEKMTKNQSGNKNKKK